MIGTEQDTKAALMSEQGLQPLIDLVSHQDEELAGTAVYTYTYIYLKYMYICTT